MSFRNYSLRGLGGADRADAYRAPLREAAERLVRGLTGLYPKPEAAPC